jgi:hypothetical protein
MPLFIGELGCGSIWRLDVAEKLTALSDEHHAPAMRVAGRSFPFGC